MFGNDQFTVSLLHFDGANGGTSFPDFGAGASTPHTWSATGAPTTDTSQFEFGTASLRPSTSNGNINTNFIADGNSSDFDFGSGLFTIDFWVRYSSTADDPTSGILLVARTDSTSQRSWNFGHFNGNYLFNWSTDGTTFNQTTWASALSAGSWDHIALVRAAAGSLFLFKNGVSLTAGGSGIGTSTIFNSTSNLSVGGAPFGGFASLNGWMDELRVSKGAARWTANFTPPVEPYDVPTNPDLWRASDVTLTWARRPQARSATVTKEDGIEAPFVFVAAPAFKEGWQVQPPQPPAPQQRPQQRAAAVMAGDDPAKLPLVVPFPEGWAVQPPQPPALRVAQRIGGVLPGDAADLDDQPPLVNWLNAGWEVQPVQPPCPQTANLASQNVRAAATMRGDDGAEDVFRRFFPMGWPVQPPQPPHPAPERRAAAVMRGDDGAYDVLRRFFAVGFEVQPVQPPHPAPERRAAAVMRGDEGDQAPLIPPPAIIGWEVQPPPPLRWPRPQAAGAFMPKEDGIQVPLFYPFMRFEPVLPALRAWPPRRRSPDPGEMGIEAPFPRPAWGWDPVPHQPARKKILWTSQATTLVEFPAVVVDAAAFAFDASELARARRPAAAAEVEPAFVPLSAPVPWGYDHPEALAARPRRLPPAVEEQLIPFLPRLAWGFDRAPDPLRRRPSSLSGVSFEAANLIVQPARASWGWQVTQTDPRARPRRLLPNLELVSSFPAVWTSGWEVQPWQPPRFSRSKTGAFMRGDDGAQRTMIVPFLEGWQPTLFFPPHPRPERAGATMIGDIGGAWGPFVYLVPSGAIAWDFARYLASAYDIGQAP